MMVTDALSRSVVVQRDAAGRITQAALPGNRTLLSGYDVQNNLVQLTSPGQSAHGLSYDLLDQPLAYMPLVAEQ